MIHSVCSRKATASGMTIAKRVRADEGPLEKITTETDEQIKELVQAQSHKDVTLGKYEQCFTFWNIPHIV